MYEKLLLNVKNKSKQLKRTNVELKLKLMELFVNRIKLEQEIQENLKPKEIDFSFVFSQEYLKQQHCYMEHTHPQMKGYYARIYGFDESDFLFIKDKGIDNGW